MNFNFYKIFRAIIIFFVILGWMFSGWPFDSSKIKTVHAAASRIQSATGSNDGATTIGITLSSSPTNGNALVVVIGTRGTSSGSVSSITQTGATWTKAIESVNSNGVTSEIWYALNVSGASTAITVNLASSLKASAIVVEYSGVLTSGALDKTASNSGNSFSPDSGTTATTSEADELWIGGLANINTNIYCCEDNGFTEVAESASTGQNAASRNNAVFEEKIVSATGTANVGSTFTLPAREWAGVIATFKTGTFTFQQSAYRWFNNLDSTDVGTVLAAQDTTTIISGGAGVFRLRVLIHVGNFSLGVGGENFKLQFAERFGSCDTNFTGETYADVTASTVIAFENNPTPADGASLTANVNDPTHGADTIVNQTYEEANNFTTISVVNVGEDGKWDFALVTNSAPGNTAYCFRIVKSDSNLLNTYSVIPQITIPAGSSGGGSPSEESSGGGTPQSGGSESDSTPPTEGGSAGGVPQTGGGEGGDSGAAP